MTPTKIPKAKGNLHYYPKFKFGPAIPKCVALLGRRSDIICRSWTGDIAYEAIRRPRYKIPLLVTGCRQGEGLSLT